jgi:hypothetical protein
MTVSAEDLKDWDDRFRQPTTDLCLECMPTPLANEIRRNLGTAPVGLTGRGECAKCGGSRSASYRRAQMSR